QRGPRRHRTASPGRGRDLRARLRLSALARWPHEVCRQRRPGADPGRHQGIRQGGPGVLEAGCVARGPGGTRRGFRQPEPRLMNPDPGAVRIRVANFERKDMDLNFTPEEEAFRSEVRQFLQEKLPARMSHKVKSGLRLTRDDMLEWHAILNERGWLANHWPKEYGGPGWGAVQNFIFEHEGALAGGPRVVPSGVHVLGPGLPMYG